MTFRQQSLFHIMVVLPTGTVGAVMWLLPVNQRWIAGVCWLVYLWWATPILKRKLEELDQKRK